MSNKQSKIEKAEAEVSEMLSKSEAFIENNKKKLAVGILVVLLLVGAFFAYKYLYSIPRENTAKEKMFRAEHYFGVDSFSLALNGNDANVVGFLDIIKKYSGTKAANVANAYAGISYYKLGDTENALKYLKKFKAKDIMLQPAVLALIGDCYVDSEKYQEAVKYFEQAAKDSDSELLSPIFLKKAGLAYEALGNTDKALACYNTIKDKYYRSMEATTVDKYIERLNLKK